MYIIGITVPSVMIHNMSRSPDMHVQKVTQLPPTSLAAVPILSSLGFGGGGTFGKSSISANEILPQDAGGY